MHISERNGNNRILQMQIRVPGLDDGVGRLNHIHICVDKTAEEEQRDDDSNWKEFWQMM